MPRLYTSLEEDIPTIEEEFNKAQIHCIIKHDETYQETEEILSEYSTRDIKLTNGLIYNIFSIQLRKFKASKKKLKISHHRRIGEHGAIF